MKTTYATALTALGQLYVAACDSGDVELAARAEAATAALSGLETACDIVVEVTSTGVRPVAHLGTIIGVGAAS